MENRAKDNESFTNQVPDPKSYPRLVCNEGPARSIQSNWIYPVCNLHPPKKKRICYRKIETVSHLSNLTKELVSSQSAKPRDPWYLLRAAHFSAKVNRRLMLKTRIFDRMGARYTYVCCSQFIDVCREIEMSFVNFIRCEGNVNRMVLETVH